MKIVVGILVLALSLSGGNLAYANSYLEMITTAPAPEPAVETATETSLQTIPEKPLDWWYDSRIVTSSPVIVSSYPKYYAWARSKANENKYDRAHEQLQNLIYAVEGGLVGWGLYEIYKY